MTDLNKIRDFAENFRFYLDLRVERYGRVEVTENMAFVEAMISVPLDVHGNPCIAGIGTRKEPPCKETTEPTPKPSKSSRRGASGSKSAGATAKRRRT